MPDAKASRCCCCCCWLTLSPSPRRLLTRPIAAKLPAEGRRRACARARVCVVGIYQQAREDMFSRARCVLSPISVSLVAGARSSALTQLSLSLPRCAVAPRLASLTHLAALAYIYVQGRGIYIYIYIYILYIPSLLIVATLYDGERAVDTRKRHYCCCCCYVSACNRYWRGRRAHT